MSERNGTELKSTCSYKAENISTDKMLNALKDMKETAIQEHIAKMQAEQARYEQQIKDINHFYDMFFCSNYEK